MIKLKENSGLLAILAIALIIRVFYLLLYSSLPEWSILTVDNYYHHNLAIVISDGNIFGDTTYFRAPFYIYTLALLYKLFGYSLWVGRIFGLLIGLGTIFTTYKLADLIFNRRVALFAGLLICFFPAIIYFESELLLDSFFMLLLEIAIYYFIKYYHQKTNSLLIFSAIFLALSIITRPTALVIIPVFALILLFSKLEVISKLKNLALLIIPIVIIISPITIRNIVIADDPVLIASQGGINFYIGNNNTADGVSAILPEPMGHSWRISQVTHLAEKELKKELKPGEVSSYWYRKGIDWITENPLDFVSLYLEKVYHNFNDREISNNRNLCTFYEKIPLLKYNPLSFGLFFIFSLFGLIFFFSKNRSVLILVSIILIYILASSLFFFNSRFRLPMLPLYAVITSATIIMLVENYRTLKNKLVVIIPFMLIVGLFSYFPGVKLNGGSEVLDYSSAGNYYFAQKDYRTAGDNYQMAAKMDSEFAEVNLNLGNYYLMSGIEDSALFYFKRELNYFPKRYKALTNLGSIEFLNHNIPSAANYADSALSLAPYDITANLLKLRALFSDSTCSDTKRFRIVFDILEQTEYNLDIVIETILLLSEAKNFREINIVLEEYDKGISPAVETDDDLFAKAYLEKYRSKNNRLSKMYYQLGFAEGISGLIDNSIKHSKKAIELDTTIIEAYINLINGYLSNRSLGLARETFDQANLLFPNHPYLLKIKPVLQ